MEIVEDISGDYFLLLGNFSLIRSDSAFNTEWSTTIDTNDNIIGFGDVFDPPIMKKVETDMLLYYSAGTGASAIDVNLVSINETGNVNWHRTFGGTGDEEVYTLRYLKSSGYYLIGSTRNWDGKSPESTAHSYVIKTDLEGNSCR
jgi:hypothetical protein